MNYLERPSGLVHEVSGITPAHTRACARTHTHALPAYPRQRPRLTPLYVETPAACSREGGPLNRPAFVPEVIVEAPAPPVVRAPCKRVTGACGPANVVAVVLHVPVRVVTLVRLAHCGCEHSEQNIEQAVSAFVDTVTARLLISDMQHHDALQLAGNCDDAVAVWRQLTSVNDMTVCSWGH